VALAEACLADRESRPGNPFQLGLVYLRAGEAQLAAGDRERAAEHLRASLEALEAVRAPVAENFRVRARAALERAAPAVRNE
jgi:hypothetical protein